MSPFVFFALAQADFSADWTKVETIIRTRYYARVKRKDEMEKRLSDAAPIARAAEDRTSFDAAVDAMIAGFHDSHFDYLTDEEQGYYMMDNLVRRDDATAMPEIDAWFRRDPDGYTIQMVLEGGAAEAAGLRVGDLITKSNGEPFAPIAALRPYVGESVTLGYRRAGVDGETKVVVSQERPLKMFLDASRRSARIIERSGKKVGYIHLWTQASADFGKLLEESVSKDVDSFILDLRGGFGGRTAGIGDLFEAKDGKPARFSKPLVVLIDHGSRSAKEMTSYSLQIDHRATLVGETTAGNVLGTFPQRVNDWSYLEIPLVDFDINGVRLEGRGVFPDVAVTPMFDVTGKDLVLEKGLEILTKS